MTASHIPPIPGRPGFLWKVVRWLVLAQLVVAGAAILLMIAATCLNVALRVLLGRNLIGVDEVVGLASAVVIACALPYTTAVKGHVAVEYFFHQLDRQGRLIVDSILRVISMALFGVLSWRSWLYGMRMLETGQVTATLQVPLFWVPMVIAVSFALVVPVVLHHLLYPGREMIRP